MKNLWISIGLITLTTLQLNALSFRKIEKATQKYFPEQKNENLFRSPQTEDLIPANQIKGYVKKHIKRRVSKNGKISKQLTPRLQEEVDRVVEQIDSNIETQLRRSNSTAVERSSLEEYLNCILESLISKITSATPQNELSTRIIEIIDTLFEENGLLKSKIPNEIKDELKQIKKAIQNKIENLMTRQNKDYIPLEQIEGIIKIEIDRIKYRVKYAIVWNEAQEEIAQIKSNT